MKNKLHILIVDDDADDRAQFIQAVWEIDSDIECISAPDGQKALELLRDTGKKLPDYIFLDLRMPRVSGRRCLIEIKEDPRLKDIPVIIFTTSRDVDEAREFHKLGAVHFISKPANAEEFYYVISFVLEEQLNSERIGPTDEPT